MTRSITRLTRLFTLSLALGGAALAGCDDGGGSAASPDGGAGGMGGGAGGMGGGGELPGEGLLKSSLARDADPAVADGDLATLTGGMNAFAFDLFQQVRGDHDNLFFSPLSIHQALGMTWAGARGQTADEMAAALHFDLPQDRLHPAANRLDLMLSSRGAEVDCASADCPQGQRFQLSIANSLWGQTGYPFLDAFLDTLAVNYGAGLQLLDFMADPDAAREIINTWVEDATNDRIQDLLPQGSVGADTRLVLTNAIYFKASWQTPFVEGATADAAFTLAGGDAVQVPTMRVSEGFQAHTGADYDAVRLPYFGGALSMILVAPPAGQLEAFEAGLTAETFAALRAGLQPAMLELSVPKFTFETDLPLTQVLQAMGMEQAFTGAADLSGMNGTGGLQITDVLHKAFVGIDEEGTEAAAATAVVVGETSVPTFEPMAIDRPFLFFIVDEPTGSVLFLGRVADPR